MPFIDDPSRPAYPGDFFLTSDVSSVSAFLRDRQWLHPGEVVESLERAGEGNMNCVMRVRTAPPQQRTFILKQSRPWVEKYPVIPAPWDRALVEAAFYQHVQYEPAVAAHLPALLAFDAPERLLLLQDLGDARDFTFLYAENAAPLSERQLTGLTSFLLALHSSQRSPDLAVPFENRDMRILNHEHIFDLPLRPNNGLTLNSITPGLEVLAHELSADADYCAEVHVLGELYLHSSGPCLIHGDFFPGSWLQATADPDRTYVIDPEFCFYGPPEWDLGVFAAHLFISGHPAASVEHLLSASYSPATFERELALQFAGAEIMRRLIGVAQLPVSFDLNRKAQLLTLSKDLVLNKSL